ncbi:adenylate/guanylate cyclase domain-containing protein [Paraconexibacter antarcticus]|uniref:Adenylate/guanylate cyclase domain-containing protein n=1 Tax=Paraconexibacter antarcticus TaxID=2949664 RepID=A0ABY5DKT7_9ACTN|nr:adenylate/guanylate cyclase domain-containing protein [Paraconexibacter antarcticus]UTI62358.1 adenylate/guanylate cyclase domain-containing protein [Paraconexibacter antarcticus]
MRQPTASTTRWARNGDTSIAYRTIGEGPVDLVFLSGLISHVEALLEEPGALRFFTRLAQTARVVLVDRRGSGLSDPHHGEFTDELDVADLEAVLDALGTERAVLMGYTGGASQALAFAAIHPERTLALLLYAPVVRNLRDEEVEWASSEEERAVRVALLVSEWGTGANLARIAPSVAEDARMRAWLARLERQSMTPSGLERMSAALATVDVRPHLGRIRVPTLIMHRTRDVLIDVRHSRYLAERIAGARLVELAGVDNLPMVGDAEAILGEIEAFLTGGRRGGGLQRELLTVLFTDIVDATGRAASIGDARWRDLLAAHDAAIRATLVSFGGEEVKTIGDAFLATFAGPPSQAVRCAAAILEAVEPLGLTVRIGMHTGECERIGGDVGGMAVHIAARVGAMAKGGEVLMSGTTFGTVVGSGLSFSDRGHHRLKGIPGEWPIFVLAGGDGGSAPSPA